MPASKSLLTVKTDTKEEESEILTELLTRLQYSPASVTPDECPDFEIVLSGNLIGVEITKYYADYTKNGSKTQQKISEWKKFAEGLKTKLSAINPEFDYLYSSIHFHNNERNYKKIQTDKHFSELTTLLTDAGLKRTEQKTIRVTPDRYPLLGTHINSIFLWNTYPENIYLWWDSALQSGRVITNQAAIQGVVDKKNESSKKCKQNYYQKWLVIYAGGIGLHDIFNQNQNTLFRQGPVSVTKLEEVQPSISIKLDSSYFTHVILWDRFTERIFLLFPYYKKNI